jgi:hypothetical protein
MTKATRAVLRSAALTLTLLTACTAQPPGDHAAHYQRATPASAQTAHGHPPAPAAVPTLPPATMKQIAAEIGCPKPAIQVDADELRQAACETSRGRYTITTFATEKGKLTWLDNAQMYGGTYLIGKRWVVIADRDQLESLRAGLGGRIEEHHH